MEDLKKQQAQLEGMSVGFFRMVWELDFLSFALLD